MESDRRGRSAAARAAGRQAAFIAGAIALMVGWAIFWVMIERRQGLFEADVRTATDAIEQGVEQAVLKLGAVDGLFGASDSITPSQFGVFADSLDLVRDPDSVAVAMAVTAEDLDAFEDQLADLYPDVVFTGNVDGELGELEEQSDYYIVAYHRPGADSASLVGYDVGSEATRRLAIDASVRSDAPYTSQFIELVGQSGSRGFIIVHPIHMGGVPVGVAIAGAQVGSMVEEWVSADIRQDMDFAVLGRGEPVPDATFGRRSSLSVARVPGRMWRVVGTSRSMDAGLVALALAALLAVPMAVSVSARSWAIGRIGRRELAEELSLAAKLSEERTRSIELLSQYELLAKNSADIVLRLDPDLRYLYVSPAMKDILGHEPSDLVGRSSLGIHREDEPAARLLLAEMKDGRETGSVEHRSRHLDGHWVWMHTTVKAGRDEDGRLEELRCSSRDISDLVRKRDDLRRARDEAARAAEDKERFLATVSHEIRTPLNAIAGMSDLLTTTKLDPEQHEYAETIGMASRSVVSMVGDLLDLGKAQAGKLRLDSRPFDPRLAAEEVVRMLAPGTGGVSLLSNVASDVPAMVVGDVDRIRQILVNLVGNALKFTQEGHVRIAIETSGSEQDGFIPLAISVSDTGIGIEPDRLAMIFEDFEQATDSTQRTYGGTGLGLGISRQLVELMDGHMGVESTAGKGSRFWFEVVLAVGGAPSLGDESCVVVGADPERERVVAMLRGTGWHVDETSESVGPHSPEVRVCAMADLGDDSLAGVVVVDTAPERGNADKVRRRGAIGYVGSPTDGAELSSVLRAAAESGFVTRHDSDVAGRSLKILAADDAPSNRLLVERTLQRRGHIVVSVADGVAALEELERQDFDVVLLDGSMPRMSGPDVTRRIREGEVGTSRHLRIVALTGRVGEQERAEAIESGADVWMAKPFDVTRLQEIVEERRTVPPSKVVDDPVEPGFDRETFLSQVAGVPDLAGELAKSVRAEWAELRTSLTVEAIERSPASATTAAHRLKGVVAQVGGIEAAALAAAVERSASSGDLDEARRAAGRLVDAMASLERALSRALVGV